MSTTLHLKLSDTIKAGAKGKLILECEEGPFSEIRFKGDRGETLVLFAAVNAAVNIMEENSENPVEYGLNNLIYACMSNIGKSDIDSICKNHPIMSKIRASWVEAE